MNYSIINKHLIWIFLSFHLMSIAQDLEWVRQFGGVGRDIGYSLTVDGSGNVYSVGYYAGTSDFDPDTSIYNLNSGGSNTKGIYISKLDRNGDFVWAKKIDRGQGYSTSTKITLDQSENIYVSGSFAGTSYFYLTSGTDSLISNGGKDGFLCKLDSNGNLLWHENIGGAYTDYIHTTAVNLNNEVLVTGRFKDTVDFDPGTAVLNLYASDPWASNDGFIQKLDSVGNLIWVAHIKTSSTPSHPQTSVSFASACFDSLGNCYVSGHFEGHADFDPGPAYSNAYASQNHNFILKLDSSGNFQWVKLLDASSCSINLDKTGNIVATGRFNNSFDVDPGPGITTLNPNGTNDIYILKLDSNANFVWGTSIGGPYTEHANGIETDKLGNIYLSGFFIDSVDFDPGSGIHNLNAINTDVFILKLNGDGLFQWVRQFESISTVKSYSIFVDDSAYIYTTGYYYDTTDFDPDTGYYELTSFGDYDAFVYKMSNCEPSYYTIDTLVCDHYISPSGNYTWSISGNYMDTISNMTECDSVLFINLTVDNQYNYLSVNACDTLVSPSGNYTWDTSGVYLDTLLTTNGCDSVLEIFLTIQNSTDSITVVACTEYLSSNGELWTSSGIYADTLVNVYGCDSVLFLDLIIYDVSTDTLTVFECDEYTSPSGNYIWSNSNIYYDTLLNTVGCDSLLVIDLTIQEDLNPNLGPDTSLCEGDSLILNSSLTGVSFLWQDGSTDSSILVTETGLYWIQISFNGCIELDSINVYFNEEPDLNLGYDTVLCEGETLLLSAYHPNSTYLWQNGTNAADLLLAESGMYWVEVSVPNCGSYRDSIQVDYTLVPEPNLGPDRYLCEGDTFVLTTQLSGVDFLWNDGSIDSSYTITETGDYWVEVTIDGCSKMDTVSIQYNTIPESILGSDTVLCEGEQVLLSAYHPNSTYLWNDGSNGPFFSVYEEGWYRVEVHVPSCGTYLDSIYVSYLEVPSPKFGNDTILCEGESLVLDVSNQIGQVTWQDGSMESNYYVENEGVYFVKVENGACVGFDTIYVDYLQAPDFELGPNIWICAGDSYHFDFTDTQIDYLWQDGSTKGEWYVSDEGWYSLSQTNICGTMVDSVYLTIDPCTPSLQMPNVFSPNGDGTNDVFSPISMKNIQVISLAIYNRWGIQLSYSTDQEIAWHGENKSGQKVNNGMYFWVLKYSRNGNGKTLTSNGEVNVFY